MSFAEGTAQVIRERNAAQQRNRLLAAMPAEALQSFWADLKEKTFSQGAVLQESGEPIETVYFPQTGMVSLLVAMPGGGAVESATIGREGSVGIHGGLGPRRAFTRAIVQVASRCLYLPAGRLHQAVEKSGAIKNVILGYTELLWVESQQIAACNAKHSAEERLCRWFLQTRARIESDTLPLTQEFLSEMLGVRRTTVTLVARALQDAGIIRYRRGLIHIEDPERLKEASCGCYAAVDQGRLPERLGFDLASG